MIRTVAILVFLLGSSGMASVTECPSTPNLTACLKLAHQNYFQRLEDTEDCEHISHLVTAAKDVHALETRACKRTCTA